MASAQFVERLFDTVQLDSVAILKIIKHCETERVSGGVGRGYLTGLPAVEQRTLEVTNCFPTSKLQNPDDEEEIEKQQKEVEDMLRRYRQMNLDYQLLGFYESAPFGACFTENTVESLFEYQSDIGDSVVIIYDPVTSNEGLLSLKAYRLSSGAMERCYNDFSPESVKKQGLTYENLFEELPITIKNSHLTNVLLAELKLHKRSQEQKLPFLDLGTNGSLEQCMRNLMGHVDVLNSEANRYYKYMVSKQKHDSYVDNLMQKRQFENDARRLRGEPALPLDDIKKSAKAPVPPTMLDNMLAAAEVNTHVQHALQSAGKHLGKLFIAEAVVEEGPLKERTLSAVGER